MGIHRYNLWVGMSIGISVLIIISQTFSFATTATTTYAHSNTPDVLITELQTGTVTSSGQEFIELYNATDHDIDFSDAAHNGKNLWRLQYFPGSKLAGLLPAAIWTNPYRTITLTGTIAAHEYYVVAATGYAPGNLEPEQTYGPTFADDGGAVQLVDTMTSGSTTTVTAHDKLAWSNDTTLPTSKLLYSAPAAGSSLQRLPNHDDEYVNTDLSTTAFIADGRLSPEDAWTPAPVVNPPVTDDTPDDTTGTPLPTSANTGLQSPFITELLPNPASPKTDEADEFIELYNSNDTVYALRGYTLETGQTTLHDFTFVSDVLLEPHGYLAFYSAETGLSLSNSGGQARLLAPDKTVISQTASYTAANDGEAWAVASDGTWHWTSSLTPDAENVFTTPLASTNATATKTAVAKPKKSSVKGVSTTRKAKSAKVAKAKKAKKQKKAKAVKSTSASTLASDRTRQPAPIHPFVLAGVAALAVGYGVYEYRHDLGNRFHQFRTDRAARRKARS